MRLSADNYIGRVNSFVAQVPLQNYPGTSVEWVVENQSYLERLSPRKRDLFPSPPGVYSITVTALPDEPTDQPGQFTVETVLSVEAEPLITFASSADSAATLARGGIYPGSVRLWLDGRRALVEGPDFSVDHSTGDITFLVETPSGFAVTADYSYTIPAQGPYPFHREQFNVDAIPGAVIAFGDRVQLDDRLAVIVYPSREEAMDVYGGKFEVSFELLIFTNDTDDRERLADYVTVKLLEIQNRLGFEGLELVDISPGSDAEEVRNEADDAYYYDRTVTLTVRVDWESYVPLPIKIQRWEFTAKSTELTHGYLDGSVPLDLLRAVDVATLQSLPLTLGGQLTYSRIK